MRIPADVTGDKKNVVGYVSAVFYKPTTNDQRLTTNTMKGVNMLTDKQRKRLLEIARSTIDGHLKSGKVPDVKETDPELLKEKGHLLHFIIKAI